MKCTIISGRNGSGKTGILLNRLQKTTDNLVITTDPAVIYIEMYMARNNIPGRCIGIGSLAKIIAEDIGLITLKESTKEIEMAIIGKILNESNLSFKDKSYNSGLINKLYSFITECKEANISSDELNSVSEEVYKSLEIKLKDISYVYQEFNKILLENGFITRDDLVSFVSKNINGRTLSFSHVYIDTLDRYNKNTVELIKSILPACEELTIAFNKTSRKAFDFDIHQEGMDAMISLYEYIDTLPYCPVEQIEASSSKDINNGLSIIEKELFNKDTKTKSTANNVVLHQSSTLYKEVDFVISKINELIENGAKYSEIIVTSSSMERYSNIIEAAMKKHGIPCFYFKNTTIDKTYLFDFLNSILDIKINGITVEKLLKICNLNFIGLTSSEIISVTSFYNRFGNDLDVALENGKKYDSNNTVIVENVLTKVMTPLNEISQNPKTVKSFLIDIYSYLEKANVRNIIIEKSKEAESEGFIHSSKELINTWNDIMSLLNNIAIIFGEEHLSLENIQEIFQKMASEKLTKTTDLYHSQLTLLDMDNAQNRKSKYLFIIGCNEGYMPKPVSVQLVSDREKIIINNVLGKDLKLSSVYQTYKLSAIYNTLILPQKKLYLSWSSNDIDFKQLRPASILTNVLKIFEDNIIKEEDMYKNDEEERFLNLLQNISLNRYKSIDKDGLDEEFIYFLSNPKYNKRLGIALKKMQNEETSFNANNILDGYKELDYFAVTRLERFNECPFKHYVEYALKPEKQKLFEETAADKGNYYHLVFKKFFDYCRSGAINIKKINYQEYLESLNIIFDEVDKIHNENFLNSSCKNRYLAYTMKEKIKTSLWQAIQQLNAGSFEVLVNEYVIGKNISLDFDVDGEIFHIIGTIDRVDTYNDYARIIDYKSGNVDFNQDKIDAGIQMQLPLYAKAIEKESVIAGMYYFKIKDFVRDLDDDIPVLKEFKLSGPTLKDMDVLQASDNSLESGSSSSIISADITLKGEISKKSKVMQSQEMNNLINSTIETAVDTIKKIKAGETKANPLTVKDFDACKYCSFKHMCNIDRTVKDSTRKVVKEGI